MRMFYRVWDTEEPMLREVPQHLVENMLRMINDYKEHRTLITYKLDDGDPERELPDAVADKLMDVLAVADPHSMYNQPELFPPYEDSPECWMNVPVLGSLRK